MVEWWYSAESRTPTDGIHSVRRTHDADIVEETRTSAHLQGVVDRGKNRAGMSGVALFTTFCLLDVVNDAALVFPQIS